MSFFNDRYGCVNLICYAEFLRYYYLAAKPQDNDWQPVELFDDLLENNFSNKIYPPIIPLNVKKFLLFCLYQIKIRIMNFMHNIC